MHNRCESTKKRHSKHKQAFQGRCKPEEANAKNILYVRQMAHLAKQILT